jgi:hypothetical protein
MGTGAHRKGYPEALVGALAENLRTSGCIARAAEAAGVTVTTAYGVIRKHPQLRQFVADPGAHHRTHGMWDSPEWRAWKAMRQRCAPGSKDYQRYGARGISVCPRWENFEHFLTDMGRRPTASHSIDRIDNDGNYEPGNCRWATKRDQAQNRRSSIPVTIRGVTKPLSGWAHENGLAPGEVWRRMSRGWSPERALMPTRRYASGGSQ